MNTIVKEQIDNTEHECWCWFDDTFKSAEPVYDITQEKTFKFLQRLLNKTEYSTNYTREAENIVEFLRKEIDTDNFRRAFMDRIKQVFSEENHLNELDKIPIKDLF